MVLISKNQLLRNIKIFYQKMNTICDNILWDIISAETPAPKW